MTDTGRRRYWTKRPKRTNWTTGTMGIRGKGIHCSYQRRWTRRSCGMRSEQRTRNCSSEAKPDDSHATCKKQLTRGKKPNKMGMTRQTSLFVLASWSPKASITNTLSQTYILSLWPAWLFTLTIENESVCCCLEGKGAT